MPRVESGVFPVFNNEFQVGINGKSSADENMKPVADLETFSVSFDNNIEEWTPMTTDGWKRRLMTGKGFSITLSGKRHIGDPGNDYLASLRWKTGQDAETKFKWIMPDGTTIVCDVVVNVTTDGGDSTNVNALEVEFLSNGKPTVTEPAGSL